MSEKTFQENKKFAVLFMTELWERFGFYTVASMLILYLIKALHYSDQQAYGLFAVFTAFIYITPLIGGYLGDKVLGYKRCLIIGVITLFAGYALLSFQGRLFLEAGLSLVIIGNGFFKSMPYALLGKLYQHCPEKIDGRFTLYYLSINIGGIPALIISGVVANYFGWNAAFIVAAVGLLIGTLTFISFQKLFSQLGNEADFSKPKFWIYPLIILGIVITACIADWFLRHENIADIVSYIICFVAFLYLCWIARTLTKLEIRKLISAVILIIFGVIFFILYYQQPTSLTLFVDRNVDKDLFGFFLPSSSFWIFNPVWIILLAPFLNKFYQKFYLSMAMKFGIGLIIMSLGYFTVTLSAQFGNADSQVSAWWIIGSYFFQSLAELLISALGTAMVVSLVPKKIVGVMMGIWFFTSTVGGILAGKLANFTAISGVNIQPALSLEVYKTAFFYFGVVTIIIGIIACCLAPWITRLSGVTQYRHL